MFWLQHGNQERRRCPGCGNHAGAVQLCYVDIGSQVTDLIDQHLAA